jgi:putative flippase GtrA
LIFRRAFRFAAVGLLNTAVGLSAIYALMAFARFDIAIANAVGYVIGFVVSFALNSRWTFQTRRPLRGKLPAYAALAAGAYMLNLAATLAAHRVLGINAYAAQLIGVAIYTGSMFLGSHFLIFPVERSADEARSEQGHRLK